MGLSVRKFSTSGTSGPNSSKKIEKPGSKFESMTPKQEQRLGALMGDLAKSLADYIGPPKTLMTQIQDTAKKMNPFYKEPEKPSLKSTLQEAVKSNKSELVSELADFNKTLAHNVMTQPTLRGATEVATDSVKTLLTESGSTFYKELTSKSEVKASLTQKLTTLKTPLGGSLTKFFGGIAKGLGMQLLKTEAGRNFLTSVISTSTRVTKDKILEEASSKEQKAEWATALNQLDIYEKGKPDKVRIDREGINLEKIKAMPADTPSLEKLKSTLIKKYELRVAIKNNLSDLFKTGVTHDAASFNHLSSTILSHLGSPESMIKTLFSGLSDPSTNLKSSLQALLKDDSTAAIIKAALGDKGVEGLELLLTEPALKVIEPLMQHLSVDTALAFIDNPVQAMHTHGEELSKIPGEIFNNLLALLTDEKSQEAISQLSGKTLTPNDLQLAAETLPLLKELLLNPEAKSPEGLSIPSQILVKVATHINNHHSLGGVSFPALPVTETEIKNPQLQKVEQQLQNLTQDIQAATATARAAITFVDTKRPETARKKPGELSQPVDTSTRTLGGWLSDTASSIASSVTTVVSNATDYVVESGKSITSNGASTLASPLLNKELDKELTKLETGKKSTKEKVTLTLNKEAVTEFATGSLALVSGFIAQHPDFLLTAEKEVTQLFQTLSPALENTLPKEERSALLVSALSHSLDTMGTAIQKYTAESGIGAQIGGTLKHASAILNSDIVQKTFQKSEIFSDATLSRGLNAVTTAIGRETENAVSKAIDSIGKEEKKAPKPLTISVSKMERAAISTGGYLNKEGIQGGILSSILSSFNMGIATTGLGFIDGFVDKSASSA